MALEAEGKDEEANTAYNDSVKMHRLALQAWPEAPYHEKLSSYLGTHTVQGYMASGCAETWVKEIEELLASEERLGLPGDMRAHYLSQASEMAVQAGLHQKAVDLANKALIAKEESESACSDRLGIICVLGSLLIAHHAAGDKNESESVAERIEEILRNWEEDAEEGRNLPPESSLPAGYNLAARTFLIIQDWERAIRASKRATELWDFGPNHWFLAVSLWAGRRDREGALNALRNAARDKLNSGKAKCRNLRDDFMRESHFANVLEDADFLTAVEVLE